MPPVLRTGEAEWFRRGSGFVVGQQASIAPQSSWGQLDGWWEGAGVWADVYLCDGVRLGGRFFQQFTV